MYKKFNLNRYTPKSASFEVLKTTDFKAGVHTDFKDDVERALKSAQKIFLNRYEAKKDTSGSDAYLVSRKLATNNLPMAGRANLMLGHFIAAFLYTPIRNKTVREFLVADQPNNIKGQASELEDYYEFKAIDVSLEVKKSTSAVDGVPLGGMNESSVAGELTASKKSLKYSSWIKLLNRSVDVLLSKYYGVVYDSEVSNMNDYLARIEATVNFVQVLNAISFKEDDGKFSSYLIQTLQTWISVYNDIANPMNTDSIKYLDLETYDSYELLNDSTKMLDALLGYMKSNNQRIKMSQIRDVYNLDFNKFTIDKGAPTLPIDFYDKITLAATNGALSQTPEQLQIESMWSEFYGNVINFAEKGAVLRINNSNCVIPAEFDVLLPRVDFTVQGDINTLEMDVSFFTKTYHSLIEQFVKFVRANFDLQKGVRLPNSIVREAPINGAMAMYHFNFSTANVDTFLQEKVTSVIGVNKTDKEFDCEPLQFFNVPESKAKKFTDSYISALYKDVLEPFGYYGSCDVTDAEKNLMINQFLTLRYNQNSVNEHSFIWDTCFLTLKAPLGGIRRTEEVYVGATVRGVEGEEFRAESVDVSNRDNVSMLDIWFGFEDYQLDDPTMYQALYESRLKMLGAEGTSVLNHRLLDVGKWERVLPTNATLFNLMGSGALLEAKVSVYRPKYFNIEPSAIATNAKGHRIRLDRKFSFTFPVPVRDINTRFLNSAKGNGNVVYQSDGLKRFNQPMVKITKTPYWDEAFKDCITGEVTLDLNMDVNFLNFREIYTTKDKIELVLNSPMTGFDCVNPGFGDMMAIISKKGPVTNWSRFFKNALMEDDIQSTFSNCLRNELLYIMHNLDNPALDSDKVMKDGKRELTAIMDWADDAWSTFKDIQLNELNGLKSCLLTATEVNDLIKKANTYDEFVELFVKLFGDSDAAKQELPIVTHDSYVDMLDDVCRARARYVYTGLNFKFNPLRIPMNFTRAPQALNAIYETFARTLLEPQVMFN